MDATLTDLDHVLTGDVSHQLAQALGYDDEQQLYDAIALGEVGHIRAKLRAMPFFTATLVDKESQ